MAKWKYTIIIDTDLIEGKFNPLELTEEMKRLLIKMYPTDALRELNGVRIDE